MNRARAGLTIVEAVVAVAILAVAVVAIVPAFTGYARVNQQQEIRTGAVAAAQQAADRLRGLSPGGWPATMAIDSGLRTYDVEIGVCAAGTPGCLTGTVARHVQLQVRYEGEVYYDVETVFTRFDD